MHQKQEGIAEHISSDPETIKNIEAKVDIYSTIKSQALIKINEKLDSKTSSFLSAN